MQLGNTVVSMKDSIVSLRQISLFNAGAQQVISIQQAKLTQLSDVLA